MRVPRPTVTFLLLVALAATVVACAAPPESDTIRVGFILVGARDDLGYNQAVWEGADELARALPDVEVLRTENVPEDATAVDAMEALIDQGASIVFATSFGHRDMAVEVARAHPDVTVLHQGATGNEADLPNFGTYFGAHSEAAFGAGIAAGHTTATGRLGFVVAFPIPATYNNINAFTLGARTVRPDATTTVAFTGDWCDPAAQASAAAAMLADDVDVLAQHQDCTSTILEVGRDAGIHVVGYHADGSEVAGAAWLLGAVWTWGPLYEDVVETVLDGTFSDSQYRAGFIGTVEDGDNPFVLTEPGPDVAADAVAELDDWFTRFASGVAHPFDGPLADRDGVERVAAGSTMDQAAIDAMDWFVEGVVGGP